METFLFQASIYLLAALIAVPLSARLGLGSVLGYLLAGIFIGPVTGFSGAETESLQHFAEFGVVMMLFLIGLELEPRVLWAMRDRLVGLGGMQVLLTLLLVMGATLWIMDIRWQSALALGMVFALSSTAIVLQTLNEKKLMQTTGGRSAFAVLLTQDIAVIPMLALLPLLAHRAGANLNENHTEMNPLASYIQSLPDSVVPLLIFAVIGAIIFGGHYLSAPIFHFIHKARLREMYTMLALLIVVGIATLMNSLGISPALGAFLAGVVLANSEFRHELESDIEPFKGLLLGLFFITVGAGIDFKILREYPVEILAWTIFVMFLKGGVLYMLARFFRLRGQDRWLFTLGLAQAGEFGFVLVSYAKQLYVLTPLVASKTLLVIALSMLLTPLAFIAYEWKNRRNKRRNNTKEPIFDQIEEIQPIIIAGIGRFGQVVSRMLHMAGRRTTILDRDLERIKLMRKFGYKAFLGDPSRPELLRAAGLSKASVLVVTLDERDAAVRLVAFARRERPDLHIIARAKDREHVYELYRAGADDIVRELFDSSLRAARYALENSGLNDFEASQVEKDFYKFDRQTLQELAILWEPEKSISDNHAYVARAREIYAELENAMMKQTPYNKEDPSQRVSKSS